MSNSSALNFNQFLLWERSSRDTVDLKKTYIDMVNDLVAGLLLSQIIYWYLPGKDGHSKIQVKHDGKEWIAKARHEWWDEIRITPKQFDRAVKILEKCGIVETSIYKFDNRPTKHLRVVESAFLSAWQDVVNNPRENPFLPKGEKPSNLPKGEKPLSPKVNNQVIPETVKTITESTSENTNKESTTEAADNLDSITTMRQHYRDMYGKLPPIIEPEVHGVAVQLTPDEIVDGWKKVAAGNGKSWAYAVKVFEGLIAAKTAPTAPHIITEPDPPLPPGMLSADPELDQILKRFGETMSDTKRLNKVKDSA